MTAGTAENFSLREFPMQNEDFARIKTLAFSLTGINLGDHKKNMVYSRLARRLRKLGINDFSKYCDEIENESSRERVEFVNAITTNLTSFFREKHHFEYLKNECIPSLIKKNSAAKRIRVWSAGCSTGEEPYSIGMVFKSFSVLNTWDVKILATDLDSNVINKAKSAIYSAERADGIPDEYRKFLLLDSQHENVRVKKDVCNLITFKQLNLLHRWPMKGPFDVIFCRNVVIYFNHETQKKLFNRYADLLSDDGSLFIGHSESLHNVTNRFVPKGRTIYERSL